MKLKLFLPFIFSLVLFIGCNKKDVQLPVLDIKGIKEIQNHSSIWIFYKTNEEDTLAILNKNNKLLNTHWIYHIDKRLTMAKIIPILEELQENRNKDSMHKKEGMLNYFSYADIVSQTISLVKFDSINYIHLEKNKDEFLVKNTKNRIYELVITNNLNLIDQEKIKPEQLLDKLNSIISQDTLSKPKITLKYPESLTYQNYLSVKAQLSTLRLDVDKNEYIYTTK